MIGYHERIAGEIHERMEVEWNAEKQPSFGTYNPSILIHSDRGWGGRMLE